MHSILEATDFVLSDGTKCTETEVMETRERVVLVEVGDIAMVAVPTGKHADYLSIAREGARNYVKYMLGANFDLAEKIGLVKYHLTKERP